MKQLQDHMQKGIAKMGILTMIVYKTLIIYNIAKQKLQEIIYSVQTDIMDKVLQLDIKQNQICLVQV